MQQARPTHLDPRRIATLLAVHRYGGIVAAGAALGVSPSAVSQQVARLEAESGQRLVDRQPAGAVLTPAGRLVVAAAERIEAELTDTRRALAELAGEPSGTVAVGASPTLVGGLLAPLAGGLARTAPGLDVHLCQTEGEAAQRDLRRGDLDLILTETESAIGRTTPAGMRDVPVLDEPWLVVLPADRPAPERLTDLAHATWLGAEAGHAADRVVQRAHAASGATTPLTHRYDDYAVALALVAADLGVAVVPALAARDPLPEAVQVVALPGLGTRQIVARHRTTGGAPGPATLAVLDQVVAAGRSVAAGVAADVRG
ncbi:LysR family transcriptional regulator [Isoptericola sp. NPDC056578]|uniref:LysR family transcriptional regulator n=1 Tax=unclassified Isoptericola TaxID=2623355 RepID=UPI0036A860B5